MHLRWHGYKYYPYERELAYRELAGLFENPEFNKIANGIELHTQIDQRLVNRLTYFSEACDGKVTCQTLQSRLESAARHGKPRQATRYSVHGLHEYKGKFNPQVVRAVLNILNVQPGEKVLDPFCGSGTTLVECSHSGMIGYGIDLNPFAVYLTNAKLQALSTPARGLSKILENIAIGLERIDKHEVEVKDDERHRYLQSWFDSETLQIIESVRRRILNVAGDLAPVFLGIASNLLRDYSLQDPNDLRMRRRKSPLPEASFVDVFLAACRDNLTRLSSTQEILGIDLPLGEVLLADASALEMDEIFDAAITSPPYAMALPYIDTQRLSLVWLSLVEPSRIAYLEAELIGSRELRGSPRKNLVDALCSNEYELPEEQAAFCNQLQENVGKEDGFRRQAIPVLLYRYLALMQRSFQAIRKNLRLRAQFALIVGRNHTVLGGLRYDIDTPAHLAGLASASGWTVSEIIPLQTYHRYGYHMNNAVNAESLVILKNL